MEQNHQTDVIQTTSPEPLQSTATTVSQQKKSPAVSILKMIWNGIKEIVSVIIALILAVVRFFIKLSWIGKLTFIAVVVVVALAFYGIGYTTGKNTGMNTVENQVEDITGYKVKELDTLVKKLQELQSDLDRVQGK